MVLIEQLLSHEEVNLLRQHLDQVPWLDGKGTAMGMAADVKSNGQADANNETVQQLANSLLAKYGECAKLVSAVLPHKIFPPCFNRYCEGETYGLHVDAAVMRLPNSTDILRSDMSMTLFLSSPDEYEGGELIIQTEFGEQKVKPKAGDAVIYPSSSLHKVTPVTSGVRLAAITWMQSMVPDTHIRELLFELDQNIQQLLSNQSVPRAQLDSLHHIYHNLIRKHSVF
ncbi:Fe2+-dependent dioxygenase [Thalassotalea sp. LPB0316]|uniref:Fe2+-dependent dioxygenase n=1 Tax=Thalassotalea sp. LPB0316 TaxID=2769490 RepID=UPI00186661AB|nr:Fe2+-dependent dioxygenase [Thalassotalea sp. LPB0316]QOL25654.1 Fe2+-dependent dioxygenase [Thalassotalea sp. LPB0316]